MRMKENWYPAITPVAPVHRTTQTRRDRSQYYLGSWITARRIGRCVKCGSDIIQGDTVKWIPCSRRLLCYSCGQSEGQTLMFRGL